MWEGDSASSSSFHGQDGHVLSISMRQQAHDHIPPSPAWFKPGLVGWIWPSRHLRVANCLCLAGPWECTPHSSRTHKMASPRAATSTWCTKKGLIPDSSPITQEHQHEHTYFKLSWGFGRSSVVKTDLPPTDTKAETTLILSASKWTPYGNVPALRSSEDLHSKILPVLKSSLETSSLLRVLST